MIIEPAYDNHKRICAICRKRINAKEIIVKFDFIIDEFNNTRKWFGHIDCVIKKLEKSKEYIKEELKKVPRIEIAPGFDKDE